MSRHNSVSNMFKRFFSREDKPESKAEANELNNLISSGELLPKATVNQKIANQVIEEVTCRIWVISIYPIDCANFISG